MKASIFDPEKYNTNYFDNITIEMDFAALSNALTELTQYIDNQFQVVGDTTVSHLNPRELIQLNNLIGYSLDVVSVLCSQARAKNATRLAAAIDITLNALKLQYIAVSEAFGGYSASISQDILHENCNSLLLLGDIYNTMILRTDVLFSQLIFGENIVATANVYNNAQSILSRLDPKSYGSFKIADMSKIEETKAKFEKIIADCRIKVAEYEYNLWRYFAREAIQVESEVQEKPIDVALDNLAIKFSSSTESIKYIFREAYLTQYLAALMKEQSGTFNTFLDKVKKYCESPSKNLVKLDDVMAIFQELLVKEKDAPSTIAKKSESLKLYVSIVAEAQKAMKDVLIVPKKKSAAYNIPKDYNTKFITVITPTTPDDEVIQRMTIIIDNLSERLFASDAVNTISLDELMKITKFAGVALKETMRLSMVDPHKLFTQEGKVLKVLLNKCLPLINHHITLLAEESTFEAFKKTHDLLRVLLEQVEVIFKSNNIRNAISALNEIATWTDSILQIIADPKLFNSSEVKPQAITELRKSFYQLNSDCKKQVDECHLDLWKFYANIALVSSEKFDKTQKFHRLAIRIVFNGEVCTLILRSAETQMWLTSLDRAAQKSKTNSELIVAYKNFLRKIIVFNNDQSDAIADCNDILSIFKLCKGMMQAKKVGEHDEFADNNIQKLEEHIEQITLLKQALESSIGIAKKLLAEEISQEEEKAKLRSDLKGKKPMKKAESKASNKQVKEEKTDVICSAAIASMMRKAPLLNWKTGENHGVEQHDIIEQLSTMQLDNNANKTKLVESVASVLSNNASSSSSSKPNVSVAAQACNNLIAAKKEKKEATLAETLSTMLTTRDSDVGTTAKPVVNDVVQAPAPKTEGTLAERISKIKFNADAPEFEMPVQQTQQQQQNPQMPMVPPLMHVTPVAVYVMYSPMHPQGVFVPMYQHPDYLQQLQYNPQQQQNYGHPF